MLKDYYIGELIASKPGVKAKAAVTEEKSLVTLNPREKVSLKLAERIEVCVLFDVCVLV